MDERLYGLSYLTSAEGISRIIFSRRLGNVLGIKETLYQKGSNKSQELIEVNVEKKATIFEAGAASIGKSGERYVLFLDDSRASLHRIKETLNNRGLIYKQTYMVVPSFKNPRWLFPESNQLTRKCGKIVKPMKFKSVVAWNLFRFLNPVGLGRFLFPARIVVAQRGNSEGRMQQYLRKIFGRGDLAFIIYTGAYGYYQKFTVQIMDKAGNIKYFAKIGHTVQAKDRIRKEHEILIRLSNIRFNCFNLPKVLHLGYMPNTNDLVMIQGTSDGTWHLAKTLMSEHVDALVELFNKTSLGTINGTELLAGFNVALHGINKSVLPKEIDNIPERLGILVTRLKSELDGVEIPVGLAHGDFSPWNIYIKKGKAFVFDWETAKVRVPLWDMYNFIFHSELEIHSKSAHDVFEFMTGKQTKYYSLQNHYISNTKKDCSYYEVHTFLLIYLFEISIWYLSCLTVQISAGFDEEWGETKFINAGITIIEEALSDLSN
jgi:hypothetical protein